LGSREVHHLEVKDWSNVDGLEGGGEELGGRGRRDEQSGYVIRHWLMLDGVWEGWLVFVGGGGVENPEYVKGFEVVKVRGAKL
jgi:hypothetical protein